MWSQRCCLHSVFLHHYSFFVRNIYCAEILANSRPLLHHADVVTVPGQVERTSWKQIMTKLEQMVKILPSSLEIWFQRSNPHEYIFHELQSGKGKFDHDCFVRRKLNR